MTKDQAIAIRYGAELHCTVRHKCSRTVGPRGGITENITRCRVSGRCQTWKRDPARFRLPVKHGLYDNGAVDQYNADCFHLPEDCPLNTRES